jgi:hypothetical protein
MSCYPTSRQTGNPHVDVPATRSNIEFTLQTYLSYSEKDADDKIFVYIISDGLPADYSGNAHFSSTTGDIWENDLRLWLPSTSHCLGLVVLLEICYSGAYDTIHGTNRICIDSCEAGRLANIWTGPSGYALFTDHWLSKIDAGYSVEDAFYVAMNAVISESAGDPWNYDQYPQIDDQLNIGPTLLWSL